MNGFHDDTQNHGVETKMTTLRRKKRKIYSTSKDFLGKVILLSLYMLPTYCTLKRYFVAIFRAELHFAVSLTYLPAILDVITDFGLSD